MRGRIGIMRVPGGRRAGPLPITAGAEPDADGTTDGTGIGVPSVNVTTPNRAA